VLASDLLHDLVLRVVRVLVLVHEDVPVPVPVVRADLLVVAQQAHRLQQQVVEVQRARAGQELPIALPDRAHELVAAPAALGQEPLRVCMRFLASETRAISAEGCMVVSCTRSSRMADLTAPSWSEASQIVNFFGRPSGVAVVPQHLRAEGMEGPDGDALRLRLRPGG
jgi:hypothetical protein